MNEMEILVPAKEIKIGGETITVKELAWPDALTFIKKLAEKAGQFSTADGRLSISPEKFAEVVTAAQDLSEWLVEKTTGKDKAFIESLNFGEAMDLVDVALSLNVRPDFFAKVRQIGSRFKNLLASPNPSTSSSGKAMESPT